MYRITGYFKDHKVSQLFTDLYDAIDYRDIVDANYPLKVTFEKGVFSMNEWVTNCWNAVMDAEYNPLKNIPDLNTRHMVMQVLAWMWCIVFAGLVGSWTAFGISVVGHVILLAAIAITVGTFETAKRNPKVFNYKFHTPSRARHIWIDGKKVKLPKDDPGGEHI